MCKLQSFNISLSVSLDAGIDQITNCIKGEIDRKFPALKDLFESNLEDIAGEMLAVNLITRHVAANPAFSAIIDGFFSGFSFLESMKDVEEWCNKFFSAFYSVGGPFVVAADNLKKQIKSVLLKKFNVSFNI